MEDSHFLDSKIDYKPTVVKTVVMVPCFLVAMSWTDFLYHTLLLWCSASLRAQSFGIVQPWTELLKPSVFWQVQHQGWLHLAKSFILHHPMAEGMPKSKRGRERTSTYISTTVLLRCWWDTFTLIFSYYCHFTQANRHYWHRILHAH